MIGLQTSSRQILTGRGPRVDSDYIKHTGSRQTGSRLQRDEVQTGRPHTDPNKEEQRLTHTCCTSRQGDRETDSRECEREREIGKERERERERESDR